MITLAAAKTSNLKTQISNNMTSICKNFTLEELTASATAKAKGIRNQPGQTDVINLCALVHKDAPAVARRWDSPSRGLAATGVWL